VRKAYLVAAPILRLVAVTGDMTFAIAVAALDDARLVALLGYVALLTAVMASTTSTASTSTRGRRLGAVGLVVAGSTLAKVEEIRAEMERDGRDGINGANKGKEMNIPGLVAVEAKTVATSTTAGHRLARLGALGFAMTKFTLVLPDTLHSL
jgi:hypothetical protein